MIATKIIKMNNRGQIVLPVSIRRKLGLEKDSDIQLSMMDDGAVVLRPVTIIPKSYLLKNNKELRQKVWKSYEEAQRGEVVDEAQLDDFLDETK